MSAKNVPKTEQPYQKATKVPKSYQKSSKRSKRFKEIQKFGLLCLAAGGVVVQIAVTFPPAGEGLVPDSQLSLAKLANLGRVERPIVDPQLIEIAVEKLVAIAVGANVSRLIARDQESSLAAHEFTV